MIKLVVDFSKDIDQDLTDGRLNAPAFHRNYRAIAEVLQETLTYDSGNILEIGSGTGQHITHFGQCFPHYTWWPSDPQPEHIESIEAWRIYSGIQNIRHATQLDATQDWDLDTKSPSLQEFVAVFSANVAHISPWVVTQNIIAKASKHLMPEGQLILYGPYSRQGDMLSEGNINFDRALRDQSSEWGIRDVDDVNDEASRHEMVVERIFDMPANNSMLIVKKVS